MEQTSEKRSLDTLRCIYERRAVRKYLDKHVPVSVITHVISAGKMAPSAMNRQPWKFYVLTNRETIRSCSRQIAHNLEKTYHHALANGHTSGEDPIFHGAPVVIFITGPVDNEWAPVDVGMCAQNMMLAASALGLDTCPIGLARFIDKTQAEKLLYLSDNERVLLAVILGYGNELPPQPKRIGDNIIFIG
jgi:nitroreductase